MKNLQTTSLVVDPLDENVSIDEIKRGKKSKNLKRTSLVVAVAPMDENVSIDEIKKGKPCLNCGIPSLKTVGELVFNSEQNIIFSFPERKVLPLIVATSFIVYFGVALMFYFQI